MRKVREAMETRILNKQKYRFERPVFNITVDSAEKEGTDPANWGYGLKSALEVFEETEPVQVITTLSFVIDNGILNSLPPQSALVTHDSVFANPQAAVSETWARGVTWFYMAHIDLKHPNIASPVSNFPPLLEHALLYSDWILTPSDYFKEYIIQNYGKYVKDAERYIIKVRLYRPREVFYKRKISKEEVLGKYGIEYREGQKVVLNVGRMEMLQKNAGLFDSVARRFWEEEGDEYIFVKIGGGRHPITRHKNLIHISKLPAQELAKFYSVADIYLSTSYVETFGLTILEYIMCGGESVVITKETGLYLENKENFSDENIIDIENVRYEEIKEKILNAQKYKIKNPDRIIEKYSDKEGILNELNNIFKLGKSNEGDRFWRMHFLIQKNTDVVEGEEASDEVVMWHDDVGSWRVKVEEVLSARPRTLRIIWKVRGEVGINEMGSLLSKLTSLYLTRIVKMQGVPEGQHSFDIETEHVLREAFRG